MQYFDQTLLPTRLFLYLMIALAVEIQWHVVGAPSDRVNDWQHSRTTTAIRVGGWLTPTLQDPTPNVHNGG